MHWKFTTKKATNAELTGPLWLFYCSVQSNLKTIHDMQLGSQTLISPNLGLVYLRHH